MLLNDNSNELQAQHYGVRYHRPRNKRGQFVSMRRIELMHDIRTIASTVCNMLLLFVYAALTLPALAMLFDVTHCYITGEPEYYLTPAILRLIEACFGLA